MYKEMKKLINKFVTFGKEDNEYFVTLHTPTFVVLAVVIILFLAV